MQVIAVVAYSASLVHFCSAAATVEDWHSDPELVVCLAAVAAEVVLLGSELVPDSEELLVFVADSYWLDSATVGSLEWHVYSPTSKTSSHGLTTLSCFMVFATVCECTLP